MRRQAAFVARWAGRGLFKATALVAAFVLIVAAWLWDASLLTAAADENLRLIKAVTQQLPPDWASKTESALRIFGADRALLLIEDWRRAGIGQMQTRTMREHTRDRGTAIVDACMRSKGFTRVP